MFLQSLLSGLFAGLESNAPTLKGVAKWAVVLGEAAVSYFEGQTVYVPLGATTVTVTRTSITGPTPATTSGTSSLA